MNFARHRPWAGLVSTEALCARILERHRDAVRVRNANLAVANLARIIDATLKLSNWNGFHATSLRDLAKASGLGMGGLYSYFDNKKMLLSMIKPLLRDWYVKRAKYRKRGTSIEAYIAAVTAFVAAALTPRAAAPAGIGP